MQNSSGGWQRLAKAYVKGVLRRGAGALLPSGDTRAYQAWIKARQLERIRTHRQRPTDGLLSILTPVWDGSPVSYLRQLAASIVQQNSSGACDWVILDNGCSNARVKECLAEIAGQRWVKLEHAETNLGITRGLRRCLERAEGRYILPVDADDLLYPDALQVVASAIIENNYPPLLYTDEDNVNGRQHEQPYFKPDWDRVLLLNSAYIAHLGVIDRRKALELGAYSDPETEGSPDWDLFLRFFMAGQDAVHIPEIVYSWRVHGASTADDFASKPFVLSSQRRLLQRFLDSHPLGSVFELEPSPLFQAGDHWHFRRIKEQAKHSVTVVLGPDRAVSAQHFREMARACAKEAGLFCLLGDDIRVQNPDWLWEAIGITELHPDTVMIGGRIWDPQGAIDEAGLEFDAEQICFSPNRGRPLNDPGYFGQIWKQRSVGAVSSRFCAIQARFLVELLEQLPAAASIGFLGAWAGAFAFKTGKRIVYTPFLSGQSDRAEQPPSDEEVRLFRESLSLFDDTRFYPAAFSRRNPYRLLAPPQRASAS